MKSLGESLANRMTLQESNFVFLTLKWLAFMDTPVLMVLAAAWLMLFPR